jgi:hypothetical protein
MREHHRERPAARPGFTHSAPRANPREKDELSRVLGGDDLGAPPHRGQQVGERGADEPVPGS